MRDTKDIPMSETPRTYEIMERVRGVLNVDGLYVCGDVAKPRYTIPLFVHGGDIFSMVLDGALDPARFLPTATFHGPYFGDPEAGERGRLLRELAELREALTGDALVREIQMQLRHYEPICVEKVREQYDDIRQGIDVYLTEHGLASLAKERA